MVVVGGRGRKAGSHQAAPEGAAREAEGEQGRRMLWHPREKKENNRNRVVGVSMFHNHGDEQLTSPYFVNLINWF